MKAVHTEPARNDLNCQLRLGVASWDDGDNKKMSVKYTSFRQDGRASRAGEFPVEALPQALDFAIRKGYVSLDFRQDE